APSPLAVCVCTALHSHSLPRITRHLARSPTPERCNAAAHSAHCRRLRTVSRFLAASPPRPSLCVCAPRCIRIHSHASLVTSLARRRRSAATRRHTTRPPV
ncbi:MAG: hypothetical protein P4M11_08530, partial [Candidatus Pacebacteria bacterium]|nr:hypothetical protein [Candidatus Paceibacterota bacterium]